MYRILSILILCVSISGCAQTRTLDLNFGGVTKDFAKQLRSYEVGKPKFDPDNPLLKKRIVFINGPLNFSVSQTICESLVYLDEQSKTEPIKLLISSRGGDGFAYVNIANMMKSITAPVDTINVSFCGSAAVWLFVSATGNRYAMEDSHFMIHAGTGSPAKIVKTYNKIHEDLFRSKCELPSDWFPLKDQEFLFSAKEAKEYKVVDQVLTKIDL